MNINGIWIKLIGIGSNYRSLRLGPPNRALLVVDLLLLEWIQAIQHKSLFECLILHIPSCLGVDALSIRVASVNVDAINIELGIFAMLLLVVYKA